MIQTKPENRVTCKRILNFPFVAKKLSEQYKVETEKSDYINYLLKTIKIPKNILNLTDNLPQPNYDPIRLRKTNFSDDNPMSKKNRYSYPKSIFLSLNVAKNKKKASREESRYKFRHKNTKKLNLPLLKKMKQKQSIKNKENIRKPSSIRLGRIKKIGLKKKMQIRSEPPILKLKSNCLSINRIYASNNPLYYNPYLKRKKFKKNMRLAPIKKNKHN